MTRVLGLPLSRDGSGTSWLPDNSPMYAVHRAAGPWMLMLHGNLFVQFIDEPGARGDDQFGSINWIMPMARRPLGNGSISFRGMFSVEAATVGKCGYPNLLASGELCDGGPLVDRQHPHDLFMELAAVYERPLGERVGLQLYGALAGEPALGPTAFPHRVSAGSLVLAPMTHHWLDSTHISFGVVTAGIFQKRWKAEASVFNGREPDEDRYGVDLATLDSYSGRFSWLPSNQWSLQVSAGRLKEAEAAADGVREDVGRVTASATYQRPIRTAGLWSTTVGWGLNSESDVRSASLLVETNAGLDDRNTLFGRFEIARKPAHDLRLPALGDSLLTLAKLQLGYQRTLRDVAATTPGLGIAFTINRTPTSASEAYGTSPSTGVVVFFSLRPKRMQAMTH